MKTVTQNVFLFLCVLAGLSPLNISLAYCDFHNITHERGSGVVIYNSSNQANAKESSLAAEKAKQYKQPNILLIGVETLRADHVSYLGYCRNTTPTLDRLAKEGVVFSRAIATSSWTIPTVMSVFTSLYPGVHRTTDYEKRLPEGRTTLAEILKENGYTTVAFVSNPALDHRHGFSKGFDLYDDFSVQLDLGLDLFENNNRPNREIFNAVTNEAVNHAAMRWLQKNHQKPFFMFVFYLDPHHDYVPPPPFDTLFDPNYKGSIDGREINREPRISTRPPQRDLDHIVALYDGEIRHTDEHISKLLVKFAEYGLLDEMFIIVFGDHGDEFYEHGSTSHARTLYDELIHVPLIFRWLAEIPRNKRIDTMVSQVDIMPTILDYLDIEYNDFMQGSSLSPLIEGRENKLHDLVYAEVSVYRNKRFSAAISKDDKFILDLNSSNKQLFDLSSDPDEQINIYKEKSHGPIALERHLSLWLANNERLADRLSGKEDLQKVELDENLLRQLKALGYIQ